MKLNSINQGRALSSHKEFNSMKSPQSLIPLKDTKANRNETAGPISGEGGKVTPVRIE